MELLQVVKVAVPDLFPELVMPSTPHPMAIRR